MIAEHRGDGGDTRPLIDRIGARNVNILIGAVYLVMWWWGFATFLLIPAFVNTAWPISHALAFVITVFIVHFAFVGIGAVLVPGYNPYPVQPMLLYLAADVVLLFSLVAISASYIRSAMASTVPLVATWLVLGSLAINMWKLYEVVFPVTSNE